MRMHTSRTCYVEGEPHLLQGPVIAAPGRICAVAESEVGRVAEKHAHGTRSTGCSTAGRSSIYELRRDVDEIGLRRGTILRALGREHAIRQLQASADDPPRDQTHTCIGRCERGP